MTILCCGGGTMGPVTPLLAVIRRMKELRPELSFVWAGTPDGPEREIVESEGITFYAIPVAKLARYFTFDWFRWPGNYLRASRTAKRLLEDIKPALVVSVGGFTSVPVIRAAARRNIPCAIHQLDVEPGLANRTVARLCTLVTTSFAYATEPFAGVTTETIPTPCRFASVKLPTRSEASRRFGLDQKRGMILIVGGGTGAQAINEAIWDTLEQKIGLAHLIHLTGKGKGNPHISKREGYLMKEFFDEDDMLNAYVAADLVITRAGMGGLSDLACLKKAAIVIPIPNSHQEKNAERMPYPIVRQGEKFSERLFLETKKLLHDSEARRDVGDRAHAALPTDDGTALAKRWVALISA